MRLQQFVKIIHNNNKSIKYVLKKHSILFQERSFLLKHSPN